MNRFHELYQKEGQNYKILYSCLSFKNFIHGYEK